MTTTEELWVAPDSTGRDDPYLRGQFAPVRDERNDADLRVIGELPDGLTGVYMRNGANPYFDPPGRYHVFDGDGMVHSIYLDGEGDASYANRWVRSRALEHERERGGAIYGGLSEFGIPDDEAMAASGLYKNTANTNIIRHAGKYLALMEGTRPTQVTRDLATVGEYDFDGRLQGAMTAHPRFDSATGAMLMFGYSPFPPYLRYHEVDRAGALTSSVEVPIGRSVMIHDFVVTPNHVVFFDLPALFDAEALIAGGTAITWRPEAGARIGIMSRGGSEGTADRGEKMVWIEVDPFYVFHFMNAWEDPFGSIIVDGCRAAAMPTAFGDEPLPEAHVRPYLWRWEIDPAVGVVKDNQLHDQPGDFPRINEACTGRPYRYGTQGHAREWSTEGVEFDGVIQFDHVAGRESIHVYGPTHVCGEAVFAADPEGHEENDGWLLNFVTDLTDDSSELVVLDARDITAGPVARVLLPRRVPFGFHGNWMPDAT
jgi:carotenoid cleavage dioxygenase